MGSGGDKVQRELVAEEEDTYEKMTISRPALKKGTILVRLGETTILILCGL